MSTVSTPVTIPSAAKQAPIALRGVHYDQLTEEKETRAWLTDGSACYAGTTQTWTVAALQPLSGTMKDTSKKRSSQWAELWTSTHGHTFCLEGEMTRHAILH